MEYFLSIPSSESTICLKIIYAFRKLNSPGPPHCKYILDLRIQRKVKEENLCILEEINKEEENQRMK
jgi:hypothetical protein